MRKGGKEASARQVSMPENQKKPCSFQLQVAGLYDRQKGLKVEVGGHKHSLPHSRTFWEIRATLGASKKPDLSGVIRMHAWPWLLTIPTGLSNHSPLINSWRSLAKQMSHVLKASHCLTQGQMSQNISQIPAYSSWALIPKSYSCNSSWDTNYSHLSTNL